MEIKKLIYVGELDRTPDAPDHRGIIQGLNDLRNKGVIDSFIIVDPIIKTTDQVIEECNRYQADLVIHGNTDSLSKGVIPKIQAGKSVFFMGDYRPTLEAYQPDWEVWKANSKGLDFIALSNKTQLEMWKEHFGIPTFFWPHGCVVVDELEMSKEFEKDIVFIGAMANYPPYNNRFSLIQDINARINNKVDFINHTDVEGRNRIWRDLGKIYHSSKLVLDISHFWDVDSYASGRYWYSAGLGACSITKRFPGCEDFYQDKVHKLYFDTPEEAAILIEDYLTKKKERNKIKKEAYLHNKKHHNYTVRFEQLFKEIGV